MLLNVLLIEVLRHAIMLVVTFESISSTMHTHARDSFVRFLTLDWKPHEGKIFERYRLGERAMLCRWVKDQLNTANHEP